MDTKQTLLGNLPSPGISDIMARIDFSRIEEFVTTRFSRFIESRSRDLVKYDLNYDVETPTDAFLTHLMETGSVELLAENGLLQDDGFIDALYAIISAINIAASDFLHRQGIAEKAAYRCFDADPQYIFLERAVEKVDKACTHNYYRYDLTSFDWLGVSATGNNH
jgi:hypothetical protein